MYGFQNEEFNTRNAKLEASYELQGLGDLFANPLSLNIIYRSKGNVFPFKKSNPGKITTFL